MNTGKLKKLKWIVGVGSVACTLLFTGCNDDKKSCGDYGTENECKDKTDKDGKTCKWDGTTCVADTTTTPGTPGTPPGQKPPTTGDTAELKKQLDTITKERDQLKKDLANNVTDPVAVNCSEITDKELCVGACKYGTVCEDDTTTQTTDCKGNTYGNCLKLTSTKKCEWSTGGCWQPVPVVNNKYCVNKANLDWATLKVAPSTGAAPTTDLQCQEIKFGPDQVQPYEWDAGGDCTLSDTVCTWGGTQVLANANYATLILANARLLGGGNLARFNISKHADAGGVQATPCALATGRPVAGITGNNDPCKSPKTQATCALQTIKFAYTGATTLQANNKHVIALGYCKFTGKDKGCYLKDVIPEFNCAKAKLTDCEGQYANVCMVLDTAKATPSQ